MVPFLLSYFVIAYLLIPAGLFRFIVSIFFVLRVQQRSKTQEFVFAIGAAIAPLIVAMILLAYGLCPNIRDVDPSTKWNDYHYIYQTSVLTSAQDEKSVKDFWAALDRAWKRQLDFLVLYYGIVTIEALAFSFLMGMYARWRRYRIYDWVARRVLLPHVSEWSVLLTRMGLTRKPSREIWVDALSTDGTLYRGLLGQFFLSPDGALTGLVLKPKEGLPNVLQPPNVPPTDRSPMRFQRDDFLRGRECRPYSARRESYWRTIPSGAFYLPKDKILNLNITYVETSIAETSAAATKDLEDIRKDDSVLQVLPVDAEG